MSTTLNTKIEQENVLVVRLDHQDKSTNTLSPLTLEELGEVITSLEKEECKPSGVIFTSGKPNVFCSGADLFELGQMEKDQQRHFLEYGQCLFDRIAKLPIPTVAAINGHCLGGALELSLACNWRVVADDGSINIGLPESKIGIMPAWGGTTRLTGMLGPTRALPLLITGRTMAPRRALKVGLIDEVVRPEALMAAAGRLLGTKRPADRLPLVDRAICSAPPLRALVYRKARMATLDKTFGNYPAAEKIIETSRIAASCGHAAALNSERDAVIDLIKTDTCRNLMRLFFLRHEAKQSIRKSIGHDTHALEIEHAAVIGGGTMGAGITHALIRSGIQVRLVDVDQHAISAGLQRINKMLTDDRRAYRISPLEAEQAMQRVSATMIKSLDVHNRGLQIADLIVEAVAEKMQVKHEVFAMLDRLTRPEAILATNTSSLSVAQIAEVTSSPSRVIGLHFFNPVPQMPLVEVVRTSHSSDMALRVAVDLSLRIGKTPILVKDAPGFLVNRVLFPYLAEAMMMASQGAPINKIDQAVKAWGMPMGPFELIDQVGLDVAVAILDSVRDQLGITVPDRLHQVLQEGWLGRKSGKGFYEYPKKGQPSVHHDMIKLLCGQSAVDEDQDPMSKVQLRLILPMLNEAVRLMAEGVVDQADTIDLATVLGLGFAPFRGGLIRFAETMGLDQCVTVLDDLVERYGQRFAPPPELRELVKNGGKIQDISGIAQTQYAQGTTRILTGITTPK